MALWSFVLCLSLAASASFLPGCRGQLEEVALGVYHPGNPHSPGGFPPLYLGDRLVVTVGITFGSLGGQARLSVAISAELAKHPSGNISVTLGSNLQSSDQDVDYALYGTHLNATFARVDVINVTLANDTLANTLHVSCPLYVGDFASLGSLINISLEVEYGPNYDNVTSSSAVFSYGGPEVDVESSIVSSGDAFIFDRELETTVQFVIPPGSWNMSDTQVLLDFTSLEVPVILLNVFECLASAGSPNISFSNPASQHVTSFSDPSSPVAYVTLQNATGAQTPGKRRRRAAGNQAKASLVWNLFEIGNIGDTAETVNFTIRGVIGQTAALVDGVSMDYTFQMRMNQEWIAVDRKTLVVSESHLVIDKTVEQLNEVVNEELDYTLKYLHFTTTLAHSATSKASAYGVALRDDVQGFVLEYFRDLAPIYGTTGFTVTAQELTYEVDELMLGDTMTISYKAYFSDATVTSDLDTPLTHVATATWHSMPTSEITTSYPGRVYSPAQPAQTCVTAVESMDENILYDHGLAALFFFVAVVLGAIIVAIVCLICVRCCKKGPYATVQPLGKQSGAAGGRGLVMSSQGGHRSGLTAFKENSMVSLNDSIVLLLALSDDTRTIREFENLDIWWTITIDVQLEQQHLDSMVDASVFLVNKWTGEAAVPKKVGEKCNKKFRRRVKDLHKSLEDEYKEECRLMIVRLSSQNKVKLAELQRKHKTEYSNTLKQTQEMNEEERKEIVSLLKQQHQAEKNEVMQLLKLRQDEEQEKVRKEIAIRKRLAIKAAQESHLDEVILQSKLEESQAVRLLREHRGNVSDLETAMDDELSRQRMLLEEKLAKRRSLAQSKGSQTEYSRQVLNTLVVQSMGAVEELERDERLTEAEAARLTQRLRQEFMAAKAEYDKDKGRREQELHKRLSELKRRKLEERAREHKLHLDQFEKEEGSKMENNSLDPSQYMDAKLTLISSQRSEMHELELSLDDDAAKQLEELHKELATGTKDKLTRSKEGFFKELMGHGMTERMKNEILEQHQRDMEHLSEEHEEQKLKQERQLKKRLAKHRQEWIKRKNEEKQEQQMIREHEEKVVGHVLASQLAISEEDRRRILEEHEKQQVALQSSLALNKLRQRRLLEERLTKRRAHQMERLQKKQGLETKRDARKRQLAESEDEEAEEETQHDLMKKQAEERIALLSASNAEDMEDELETVRVEMMQAKVGALKEQEERLGALVAKLQLERSREIATIEEQQKALWQLKMSMLDSMTETGIIRNADCKKVIETHQKEAKNLDNKLKGEKERQEKEFKRRLRERLAEREQTLVSKQEEELDRLLETEKSRTSARLKRVALKHKHLMQMEEFRHNLEIEISQALEDLRRKFECDRLKQLQEQELQFISGLVKHGKFALSELRSILYLLFPGRTKEELEPLLCRMYNKEEREELGDDDGLSVANGNPKRSSLKLAKPDRAANPGISLEEKIKQSILGNATSSALSTPSNDRKRPNKLLKKLRKPKKKKLPPVTAGNHAEDPTPPHPQSFQGGALPRIGMARPEPVGRTATPVDEAAEMGRRREESEDSDEEDRQLLRRGGGGGGGGGGGEGRFGKSEYSY